MLSNKEVIRTAIRQSARDLNCRESELTSDKNVIVRHKLDPVAKRYYKEPISCNFVSYGSNVVVSVKDEFRDIIEEYINKFEFYRCFETPDLNWLNEKLGKVGQKVCFMAEYYLPDTERIAALRCGHEMRVLKQEDLAELYLPQWSNALCADRKELDVLGIGAYENNTLIGLAACSADCEDMRQIGVDVLPGYRRQGIASALTSNLALDILRKGKIPFYCCAWSNVRSKKNAVRSGFAPGWVEMTVKPAEITDKLIEK